MRKQRLCSKFPSGRFDEDWRMAKMWLLRELSEGTNS